MDKMFGQFDEVDTLFVYFIHLKTTKTCRVEKKTKLCVEVEGRTREGERKKKLRQLFLRDLKPFEAF